MSTSTNSSSLVTLLDASIDSKSFQGSKIISLPHPSDGGMQEFLFFPGSPSAMILQIQSLHKPFGSFFVGSRVVSNGALHVASPVDPLFFVLQQLGGASYSNQWQPLDQLLIDIPQNVQECVSSFEQYQHLCKTNNQLGDITLYKFQQDLALAWLSKKYMIARQVLERQRLSQKIAMQKEGHGNGAFTSNFNMAKEEEKDRSSEGGESTKTDFSTLEQLTLEQDACQVICDFLSTDWRDKLMHHLCISPISEMTTTTPKRSWEGVAGANTHEEMLEYTLGHVVSVEKNEKAQKKLKAQTSGLKQLAKVKTKGMKSMSSFFNAKNR